MGLVAPRHVGSSQTRARTRVPCIGRQILNHCATREAPWTLFFKCNNKNWTFWVPSTHQACARHLGYHLVITIFWDMHYYSPISQRKEVKEPRASWPVKGRASTQTQAWVKTKPRLSHSLYCYHLTLSGRMADSRAKVREVNIIFICKKIVYTTEILFSKY